MKYSKGKLLIGATILVLGIILASPALADLEGDTPEMPQLYYYNEETDEYVPWYPPWYDPENPDSFTPPEDCPWWDEDGDGEFDWRPHWGNRWNNQEEGSGYGWRRGGCGGNGPHSNRRYQSG